MKHVGSYAIRAVPDLFFSNPAGTTLMLKYHTEETAKRSFTGTIRTFIKQLFILLC